MADSVSRVKTISSLHAGELLSSRFVRRWAAQIVCIVGFGWFVTPGLLAASDSLPGRPQTPVSEIVSNRCTMMGTFVEIKVSVGENRADEAQRAIEHAEASMRAFVDVVTSWQPNSDTSRINANAGGAAVKIDRRLMDVLIHARRISEMSSGAFDVTCSPVGRLWKLHLPSPVIPDDQSIAAALEIVNYKDLVLDSTLGTAFLKREGMRIDLGGIAKGAAIDVAAQTLKADGLDNALINAGGDLYAMGEKAPGRPWVVGITNPRGAREKIIGKLPVRDMAVTTSGDYEKMVEIDGKRYHHIIDPTTGRAAGKCISVTVLAPNAETADALSTAFFVMGPEEGLDLCERLHDVEAVFIAADFNVYHSSGLAKIVERKESK